MQDPGSQRPRPGGARLALWLAGLLALAQTGCLFVAAGVAGTAAGAGYLYYKGRVYRDYPASLADARAAVQASLIELQFPVTAQEDKAGSHFFASKTADSSPVKIYLDPVSSQVPADGMLTRISVRVGAFGNEDVSARILNQIDLHLVAPRLALPLPAPPSAVMRPAPQPSGIQQAVATQPVFETAPPPLAPATPKGK